MAVSPFFDEELAKVDEAKEFSYVLDADTYGENEYSVSGYTVTGGSEAAQAHGAQEALFDLGYRLWSPYHEYRPETLPSEGVTIAKRENNFPYMNFLITYGFGSSGYAESIKFERWRTLHNLRDSRLPVGHAWPSIINAINASGSPLDPSYYTTGSSQSYFVLDDGPIEAALAEIVGAYMAANLNAEGRKSFDPNDGSQYDTETYLRFANAVMDVTRQTEPNAEFGFYAYAGQRAPPVTQDASRFYVQVALGFNDLGIGYPELVRRWGEKTNRVNLRGYGDIGAWGGYQVMMGGIVNKDYFDGSIFNMDQFKAAGVRGLNLETSTNWIKNVVSHYHCIRYCQTGSSTYDDVLSDMVAKIWDNDSNVYDLFQLWGTASLSDATLRQSCQIIDAMPDTAYRLQFRQQIALTMQHRYATDGVAKHSPQYFTRLEQNLRWNWGLRDAGVHAYSYLRREANSNVSNNGRSDLNCLTPSKHYHRYPTVPTDADYEVLRDRLAAKVATYPAEVMDGGEVVMVNVSPSGLAGSGSTNPSATSAVRGRNPTSVIVLGPGTLTVDYSGSPARQDVFTVPSGLHQYQVSANFRAEYTSPFMWWDAATQVFLHYADWIPEAPPLHWIYVPQMVRGKVDLLGAGVTDSLLGNVSLGASTRRDLTPGVLRLRVQSTAARLVPGNVNRWISLHPHWHLLPKALAKREFPSLSFGGDPFTPDLSFEGDEDTEGGD